MLAAVVLPACRLLADSNLLSRARERDDFSKPEYNRDAAVGLYRQYLEKKDIHVTERIAVLHRLAQLYSYAAGKPAEKDYAVARKYYLDLLDAAGEGLTVEVVYAKSNLASLTDAGRDRIEQNAALYGWTVAQLAGVKNLPARVLAPETATDTQRRIAAHKIARAIVAAQDTAINAMVADKANPETAARLDVLAEMARPICAVAATNTTNKRVEYLRRMFEADTSGTIGAATNCVDEANPEPSLYKTLTPEERDLVDRRRKWADEHPEETKSLVQFAGTEWRKLRRTADGRKEALVWIKANRKTWQDSPFVTEFVEMEKELSAETGGNTGGIPRSP
jgi:hypothetical protein